ncbi:MAG: hypothetical protein QOJ44_1626 [Acidimicrobiaceae bacterium]|jgi:hypothetical protein|nr:hypothetical protein [Acidimicrobiaceae bacterium]
MLASQVRTITDLAVPAPGGSGAIRWPNPRGRQIAGDCGVGSIVARDGEETT